MAMLKLLIYLAVLNDQRKSFENS